VIYKYFGPLSGVILNADKELNEIPEKVATPSDHDAV
jgi:hypothetical protein